MFRRKMKFLVDVFCMITSSIVIAVAVFTTIVNPIERIQAVILWQIPATSLVLTLMSLIYPWDRPMGKLEIALRTAVHYVLINMIVLGAGVVFDWYDPKNWRNVIAMLASIAVIFALVDGISWRRSAREAKKMNEKLKEYVKNPVDKSAAPMYNESVCKDKAH
ncbi:MAG: DUF3021 domain-containing protein [Firmicutes bacterium]|nr:DUF3021 domain-containing protein [Bacillota bacterium]